jgi:hypothetical protein
MPRVEFEPTIPVLERAKMVHALYRAATVIGKKEINNPYQNSAVVERDFDPRQLLTFIVLTLLQIYNIASIYYKKYIFLLTVNFSDLSPPQSRQWRIIQVLMHVKIVEHCTSFLLYNFKFNLINDMKYDF